MTSPADIEHRLPPVLTSQGGFPYNGEHIDYWRARASKAEAEAATLREALERSVLALDDWVSTHAPEECSEVRVANARSRIGPLGTLAYIASVQEQNREALSARTQQHGAKE
jgi:hypothetical protein